MNRHIAQYAVSLISAVLLSAGCAQRASNKSADDVVALQRADGDSTLYALVAAGSNDSILVYLTLPYRGADPDTVSILEALQRRQVFGRPAIGDDVAIVRSDSDSTVAKRVIVTERFVGTWAYQVFPKLRHQMGDGPLPPHLQQMLEEPREYSMVVKPSGDMFVTSAHGTRQADEQLPVVYPKPKRYGHWAIFNGRLVLSEMKRDTTDAVSVVSTDTADFIRMRRDTLILNIAGEERKFYRKTEQG